MQHNAEVIIRPRPATYWGQVGLNIRGAAGAVGGLMALSVVLRVFARPSLGTPVVLTVAVTIAVAVVLPYTALIRRSIGVRHDTIRFAGLIRSRTVNHGEVRWMTHGASGPDPQMDFSDAHGTRVWRLHLAYWPRDLEQQLRAAVSDLGEPSEPQNTNGVQAREDAGNGISP